MQTTFQKSVHVWEFGQPWLPQTEPAFSQGRVLIGSQHDELIIRAELKDRQVTTDQFPLNFPAFMQCDAFEIFLGPAEEKAYYELHVTPSNSVLQLFFDGSEGEKPLEERKVADLIFASRTEHTLEGWNVEARIPLRSLFPGNHSEWLLSFGRYDHTPGQPTPVISSTSPHTICNFHRKQEWRRIAFASLQ
jgi:hypothetical protein